MFFNFNKNDLKSNIILSFFNCIQKHESNYCVNLSTNTFRISYRDRLSNLSMLVELASGKNPKD